MKVTSYFHFRIRLYTIRIPLPNAHSRGFPRSSRHEIPIPLAARSARFDREFYTKKRLMASSASDAPSSRNSPPASPINESSSHTTYSPPPGDADENATSPSKSTRITGAMEDEEKKLEQETARDLEKQRIEATRDDFNEHVESQRLQRLNFLIKQSKVYTSILTEKLQNQQKSNLENVEAKSKAARKRSGKHVVEPRRSTRHGHVENDAESAPTSGKSKTRTEGKGSSPVKKRTKDSRYQIEDYVNADDLKNSSTGSTRDAIREEAQKDEESGGTTSHAKPSISARQPSLVTGAVMRDYQLAGLEWLVSLYVRA